MQYLINPFIYYICIWLLEIQNNKIEIVILLVFVLFSHNSFSMSKLIYHHSEKSLKFSTGYMHNHQKNISMHAQ